MLIFSQIFFQKKLGGGETEESLISFGRTLTKQR